MIFCITVLIILVAIITLIHICGAKCTDKYTNKIKNKHFYGGDDY